jgi:hypothetical protein
MLFSSTTSRGHTRSSSVAFGDQPAVVLDENEQHVEGARAKLDGLARSAEQPLDRIELEAPTRINSI